MGESYSESGTMTDRNFTGQNQDLTTGSSGDLYDFMYREYHPIHGRWISPDPAGLGAVNPANPQSWNRYAYVNGDPMRHKDPKGLCSAWYGPQTGPQGSCFNAGQMAYEFNSDVFTSWTVAPVYLSIGTSGSGDPGISPIFDVDLAARDQGYYANGGGFYGNGVNNEFWEDHVLKWAHDNTPYNMWNRVDQNVTWLSGGALKDPATANWAPGPTEPSPDQVTPVPLNSPVNVTAPLSKAFSFASDPTLSKKPSWCGGVWIPDPYNIATGMCGTPPFPTQPAP